MKYIILIAEGCLSKMPYCPSCRTEYVEGTTQCEDCRTPLLPGSPPAAEPAEQAGNRPGQALGEFLQSLLGAGKPRTEKDVKLVRIKTFTGGTAGMDADVARNVLRAQGIPSILPGEASAGILPVLEVPLLVAETDAERAREILRDYFGSSRPFLVK